MTRTQQRPALLRRTLALGAATLTAVGSIGLSNMARPTDALAQANPTLEINVSLDEWSVDGLPTTVQVNQPTRLMISNVGRFRHAVRVGSDALEATSTLVEGGETTQLEVAFLKPGVYSIWCPVAGSGASHRERGMLATLTVVE